jgi:hypothetical protein
MRVHSKALVERLATVILELNGVSPISASHFDFQAA